MKKMLLKLFLFQIGCLFLLIGYAPATAADRDDELLFSSVFNFDSKGIDIAFRRGANPNAVDRQTGASILFRAVQGIDLAKAVRREAGDLKGAKSAEAEGVRVLRLLFQKGAKLSARDDSILSYAIIFGHGEVVNLLLENGANPHKRDDGYSLSELAIKYSQDQIYRTLLARNAAQVSKEDALQLKLMAAAGSRNRIAVYGLLKDGAKLNGPDTCGETALVNALALPLFRDADVEFIEWLLNLGADANLPAKFKCQGLPRTYPIQNLFKVSVNLDDVALLDRHVFIVDKLLKAGANINAVDEFGRTVLHIVAGGGKSRPLTAEWLVTQGADINAQDYKGKTPADVAASWEMRNAILRKRSP